MSDPIVLALRLQGPLQSWGFDSRFGERMAGLLPSKSGLVGLVAAAMGLEKGSAREALWLPRLSRLRLLALMPQRKQQGRLLDYHTVQNVRKAGGGIKETELSNREFHSDALFFALLEGEAEVVAAAAKALQDPVFGVWLGRKTCVPSAPVFAGTFTSRAAALAGLQLDPAACTIEEEVADFAQGTDIRPDQPISFGHPGLARKPREMTLRRIKRILPSS